MLVYSDPASLEENVLAEDLTETIDSPPEVYLELLVPFDTPVAAPPTCNCTSAGDAAGDVCDPDAAEEEGDASISSVGLGISFSLSLSTLARLSGARSRSLRRPPL